MKSKKIISGLLALSLVFGGAVVPSGVAISVASGITAHAFSAEGSCYSFDEEKGVLTLRGEVNADELRELRYKSMVRSIIAEEGTVFPEDSSCLFGNYISCISIDLTNVDTSNVTNMSGMFSLCMNLTSFDVSGFNTSNVTDMSKMFWICNNLTSLDVSGIDTSNVANMSSMFEGCEKLSSLDVSGFDTGNVTDMRRMFLGCQSLTSLDVSGFDTSNVTDMYGMFLGCQSLTSLDVSGFDTSNVNDMFGMFLDCQNLTSLDVSGYDTGNVTDMGRMFLGCQSLTSLDVSGFDTSNVTDMYGMFLGCQNLTSLDVSGFDTSNVTDMGCMFEDCVNLTSLDLTGFDTSKLRESGLSYSGMYNMFRGCNNLKIITLGENFKTISGDAYLIYGDGWVNVNDLSTIVCNEEYADILAVIENNGLNTYIRCLKNTPTNIKVEYNEQYHQVRFTWDKVENAEKYGIAVYLAGKWRIQTQNITGTIYTTPKNLTPGKTYKVAIAAKVNGQWDVNNAIKNAVTVTVK